jgi:tRNA(fMet)-specific endonuclease VapC
VSDYLLDTNIVSDLVRHPQGAVAARIGQVGEAAVATSIIVAAELHFGAAKRQSERLSRQLAAVLAVLPVLPLSGDADRTYGELRARLEAAGRPIGGNDMLIAAHALTIGATLVTDNVGEFERVAGLRIENWLR